MARSKRRGTASKKAAPRLTETRLRELVTDATVDCHDDSEQVSGLFDMIADNLEPIEPVISAITKEEITTNRPAESHDDSQQGDPKQLKDK